MADEGQTDDSQKTEDPTAKRLEESRKKGQVPLSREVNNWVMLLTGTILIMAFSDGMMFNLSGFLRAYLEQAHTIPADSGGVAMALSRALTGTLKIVLLPLFILALAAFLSPFVQVGSIFAPDVIKPDFSKISPIKGFSRLFSMRSLMEFVKGIIKIAAVGVVGIIILKPFFAQMEHMVGLPLELLLDELKMLVLRLLLGTLVVLAVIAVVDLVYQRYEHNKKMRMSRQEIKDEYKQTEGDPQIKGKLRQLRAEKARQRMMQAVPTADVVITNPTHYSIALKYDPETMEAPLCVAKGVNEVALRIREVAKEHGILLFENKPLARALYDTVDIDETIPPEQYKAVAEVISFVFKQRGKTMR